MCQITEELNFGGRSAVAKRRGDHYCEVKSCNTIGSNWPQAAWLKASRQRKESSSHAQFERAGRRRCALLVRCRRARACDTLLQRARKPRWIRSIARRPEPGCPPGCAHEGGRRSADS